MQGSDGEGAGAIGTTGALQNHNNQNQPPKRDHSEADEAAVASTSPADATNSDSNKRRRTGGSTSARGVANLTPQQYVEHTTDSDTIVFTLTPYSFLTREQT